GRPRRARRARASAPARSLLPGRAGAPSATRAATGAARRAASGAPPAQPWWQRWRLRGLERGVAGKERGWEMYVERGLLSPPDLGGTRMADQRRARVQEDVQDDRWAAGVLRPRPGGPAERFAARIGLRHPAAVFFAALFSAF